MLIWLCVHNLYIWFCCQLNSFMCFDLNFPFPSIVLPKIDWVQICGLGYFLVWSRPGKNWPDLKIRPKPARNFRVLNIKNRPKTWSCLNPKNLQIFSSEGSGSSWPVGLVAWKGTRSWWPARRAVKWRLGLRKANGPIRQVQTKP